MVSPFLSGISFLPVPAKSKLTVAWQITCAGFFAAVDPDAWLAACGAGSASAKIST
jgi:hypothetical protein